MNNRITTKNIINHKKIPAQKTKLNGFERWQTNLHRSKAASYNLCEVTKNIGSGIILVQEPWTYGGAIRSKLRGWKHFQGNEKDKRPRACIYVTSDMTCSLIPQFSSEDVVAVRIKRVRREGDSFIFVSAYMAMEEPAPPEILKELLSFNDRDNIPTVIGTDTNAHHTVWGSPTSIQKVWICSRTVLVRTCTSVTWAISPCSEQEKDKKC